MKAQEESVIQPMIDPYKKHKVVINGTTYFTKLDRKTNKPLYKKKFSVSIPGVKNPPRPTTKEWRTSITKVNQDVEKMRSEIRSGVYGSDKKEKHLYEDVVNELYEKRIEECKVQNKSFETIEKYLSNNKNYVLSGSKGYPSLQNKFIEDLTINEVKELKKNIISYALKNDLSKLTVSHIFTNIDRTLVYAGECQYIKDELANNVRIAPVGAKARKQTTIKNYLLKKEYDEMMKVFDTSFEFSKEETPKQNDYRMKLYKTFIECGYKLGFRKGEGFALRWKNYLGDSIIIESTLNTKGVKKHLVKTSARVINPKTESSIRIMKTPASIRKCLDDWKEYCLR